MSPSYTWYRPYMAGESARTVASARHTQAGEVVVRPYRAADRGAVRAIAYRAGYMGEPPDWYWRDAISFADIWTAYYTDHEPESAFVAESAGRVVGYLLGCFESARAPSPAVALGRQVIRRFLLFRPGTAGFLWRSIYDTARQGGSPTGELNDPRWPSHLHMNLLSEARGRGVGAQLMRAWLCRLREVKSPGCHLATLAENTTAVAFFERMGFRHLGAPVLVPGMRLRSGGRMHLQLMVQELSA
jgi:GNAT superfamily N-acetyltransferase